MYSPHVRPTPLKWANENILVLGIFPFEILTGCGKTKWKKIYFNPVLT
jgi:hypothetical protein